MSWDKGLGSCMIPRANGLPCGGQIQQGEPIGTVLVGNGSRVGHRRCYNDYYERKQQEERESMAKRINQAGPGGPVDLTSGTDAIMGSVPLVPKEKEAEQPVNPAFFASAPLAQRSVADLPFEEEPVRNTQDSSELPPSGASAWTVEEQEQLKALQQHLLSERAAKEPKKHLSLVDVPADADQVTIQVRSVTANTGTTLFTMDIDLRKFRSQ